MFWKAHFLFILFFAFSSSTKAQLSPSYIQEKAIAVDTVNYSEDLLYSHLSDYDLILVGERHGSQEPAALVLQFARLISKKETQVIVALEIPEKEMQGYMDNPSRTSLQETPFFSKPNKYGRNTQACFDLILGCAEDNNIQLLYMDNAEKGTKASRDSMMYLSLLKARKSKPNIKIITLSGNIHNWLKPFKGKSTLGSLCFNDSLNFTNICSINHLFGGGTTLNNKGSGLRLDSIPFQPNLFSKAVSFSKYLLFETDTLFRPYNAIFYSRLITASP